jgi:transcriptional regulator with XRE-family HTH domain
MPRLDPSDLDEFMLIDAFRVRRSKLGLTQRDIDVDLGMAAGLCSKWECGDRVPNASSLSRWADALSCRLELIDVE